MPGTVFNDALTVVMSVAGDLPHLVDGALPEAVPADAEQRLRASPHLPASRDGVEAPLAVVHGVQGGVEEAHRQEHQRQAPRRLRRVERLQPELARHVGVEAGHGVPHVVRLVEVRPQKREVVPGGQRGDRRGVEPVPEHVIGERAAERPGGELREHPEVDVQPGLLGQRSGARGRLREVLAHGREHLHALLHERLGDLEDAIEVLGVLHEVDEAVEGTGPGDAADDDLDG